MASENWSPPELTREQRLAETLVKRYGLSPPVDVHAVAARHADVQEDDIPGHCDGLVVGLTGVSRPRPLIVLRRTGNLVRQRFTAAHELGHVLLPWHGRSALACDVTSELSWDAYFAKLAEAEANRFAGGLLVPQSWLAEVVRREGPDELQALMQIVREAEVSAHVACLALSRCLPPGRVFAVLDQDGCVALAGVSPQTSIDAPATGLPPDVERLERFADSHEVVQFGSRTVAWWTFRASELSTDTDARESRVVLASLLERYAEGSTEQEALRRSFAGIVGSANNSVGMGRPYTADELYSNLRRAFTRKRRGLPDGMLDDPEFAIWMRKRAREIAT